MLSTNIRIMGSGGVLNISRRSELPVSVQDRTIVIITTSVGANVLSEDEPQTPITDGLVWIEFNYTPYYMGSDGSTGMKLLKAQIYTKDIWQPCDAYHSFGNKWVQFSSTVIHGVARNVNDSNPYTTLTYIDGSAGLTSANMTGGTFYDNGWMERFPYSECYPCMVKEGAEYYKLNKDNLAQKADGTTADITNGADGDAFRYVPEMWIDFENQKTRISSAYQAGWYHVPAHYWPLFGGHVLSGRLRSLAGKTITTGITRAEARAYANANGTGYQQLEWRYFMAEIAMFMNMFKSLDGQGALGRGYVSIAKPKATGTHLTKGACWGSQATDSGAVFLWSEITWEFLHIFVDGFWTNASNVMHVKNGGPYTDSTTDMINTGKIWPASSVASRFDGDNSFGIWPTVGGGTTSTHYCDNFYTGAGNNILCACGSFGSGGLDTGPFFLYASEGSSYSNSTHNGAALSFTPQT